MKFFAHPRTKRNTAFAVLLVWLFAMASGVANACLLETPELNVKVVKASAVETGHSPAEWVGHAGASAGHHDDSDSSSESCLKVCDDGARTLPKAVSNVDQTDPGPAPLLATLWTGSAHVISVSHRPDGWAVVIVGPPFRLRYPRLAL